MTVNICRSSHNNNFIQPSTYMQIEVARIFPDSQPSSGKYGKRRHIKAFGRGENGHGDGKIRERFGDRGDRGGDNRSVRAGGRGSGKPNKENGIDISDPIRWYEQDELSALLSATRNYMLQHPDRKKAIEERKKGSEKKRGTLSVGASQRSKDEQGKLITPVVNAQRNVGTINSVSYPKNGSTRNRNTAYILRVTPPTQVFMAGSSEASALTFDHLGNIVE